MEMRGSEENLIFSGTGTRILWSCNIFYAIKGRITLVSLGPTTICMSIKEYNLVMREFAA